MYSQQSQDTCDTENIDKDCSMKISLKFFANTKLLLLKVILFSKNNQKEVVTVRKIKSFSLAVVELVKNQFFISVGGMLILKMKMELSPILRTIIIICDMIIKYS